jgi:endo-alpha-N-acetylgalactosaminidase
MLMDAETRVENAVANPGFEDGSFSPWSTNGVEAVASKTQVHGGAYGLAETGAAGTVYQDINGLEPGRTYTLSAWASASPGSALTAQLIVFNPSDDTQTSSRLIHCSGDWQPLSRTFTVGREGAIRIHLARGPGSGTVSWDDVHISTAK